jgi:hypothetical protein
LKNRNLRNELMAKHANEIKSALDVVKNNLSILNCIQADIQASKKLGNSGQLDRSSAKSITKTESKEFLNKSHSILFHIIYAKKHFFR